MYTAAGLPAARRRCRPRAPGRHRAVCPCGDAGTPISSAMLLGNKLARLAGSDEPGGTAVAALQLQVELLCWRGWWRLRRAAASAGRALGDSRPR